MLPSHKHAGVWEIGIDEAGRGPLFGPVVAAAVVLPRDGSFDVTMVKDSKRFTSKRKLKTGVEYIKSKSSSWAYFACSSREIDARGIRHACIYAMHRAASACMDQLGLDCGNTLLLVDGNDFKPLAVFENDDYKPVRHETVVGGDNSYASIAAASMIAKWHHDEDIAKLCAEDPSLDERYDLRQNKGYGTKKHIAGLKEYGPTANHRMTFARCH